MPTTAVLNKDSVAKYLAGVQEALGFMIINESRHGSDTPQVKFLQAVSEGLAVDFKDTKTLTQTMAAGTMSVRIGLASKQISGSETGFDLMRPDLLHAANFQFQRQADAQAALAPPGAGTPRTAADA